MRNFLKPVRNPITLSSKTSVPLLRREGLLSHVTEVIKVTPPTLSFSPSLFECVRLPSMSGHRRPQLVTRACRLWPWKDLLPTPRAPPTRLRAALAEATLAAA